MRNLVVHTDGGSRGNPGPAAIGFVISEGETDIYAHGEVIGLKTNNEAEYTALIKALAYVLENFGKELEITCVADSELMVKQLNGEYKVRHDTLIPLYERVIELKMNFVRTTFTHVRRESNKLADKLVNNALDNKL